MSSLADLDHIIETTRAKQSRDGWRGHCPAHDDRNPSLSIRRGDNGDIFLKCFAG
jgi:DNA primase